MHQALVTMLTLQDQVNRRIHADWPRQDFAWYRAIWTECAELMEHQGFKWWKHHRPDREQVQLEAIDIWHFGLSALLVEWGSIETAATEVARQLADWRCRELGVLEATEALAADVLARRRFSPLLFRELLHAVGLDFEGLYGSYVGKNVLNRFRVEHGYGQGHYRKVWAGREDNQHLVELAAALDPGEADFGERLYAALAARYRACGQTEEAADREV